ARGRGGKSEDSIVRRRQVSALDVSCRARADDVARSEAAEAIATAGARLDYDAARTLVGAGAGSDVDRDVSARKQTLSRCVSVRWEARAANARYADHAPPRARGQASAWVSRQRICDGGMGP